MFVISNLQGAGFILIRCVWFLHVKQLLFVSAHHHQRERRDGLQRACSETAFTNYATGLESHLPSMETVIQRSPAHLRTEAKTQNPSALIPISRILFNHKTVVVSVKFPKIINYPTCCNNIHGISGLEMEKMSINSRDNCAAAVYKDLPDPLTANPDTICSQA